MILDHKVPGVLLPGHRAPSASRPDGVLASRLPGGIVRQGWPLREEWRDNGVGVGDSHRQHS